MAEIQDAIRSADEEARRMAVQAMRGRPLAKIRELLFLAMGDESWRVRKEAVEVLAQSAPDQASIGELLELLRNEENAGLRNSAVEALTRLGTGAATMLIRLASDPDPALRKFVIDVMGAVSDPLFLPSLLVFLRDPDENVAAAAAEHLGGLGHTAAVPELLAGIVENPSPLFRFSALTALGKIPCTAQVPPAIIALADLDILRGAVYECLGSIGDETVAQILLDGFRARQRSSRKAAVMSWYRLFLRSGAVVRRELEGSLRSLAGSECVPAIMESLDDSEPKLGEAAAAILGIIGDTRAVPALLSAFANERISRTALAALKRLGPAGAPAVAALYPGADEARRCAICEVIGELSYREGGEVVRTALGDLASMVRRSAAITAGSLGLTGCIPELVLLLDDPDAEVRRAAISSLNLLALVDRGALQGVARRMACAVKPEHRRDAAMLQAALGDGESLSLLVKDEDPAVRRAAVTASGKLRCPAARNALVIALVDEDPEVRTAAAEALGEIGGHALLEPLLHALNDEDCWVQSAILRSIAKIDMTRLLPAIRRLFPRSHGVLMLTCLELLEGIGTAEAMELVETARHDRDDEIRALALSILGRRGAEGSV